MTAETDEALAQMDRQAALVTKSQEAAIGHQEAHNKLDGAKASLYSALAFMAGVGTLTGIGWSIWWWVR